MGFAPDDEMIETLAPDRSDQPFSEAILPRRSRCDGLVPYAHGTQTAGDDGAVDAIPIANNVRGLVPRESLGELARDPFGGRIGRHVDPDEVSPVQPDDDEGIRRTAKRFLNEYHSQLRPFEAEYEVAPGVVVRRTGGHTPGHSVVRLASG